MTSHTGYIFVNDLVLIIGKAQLKSKYENQPERIINGLFDFEYSELMWYFCFKTEKLEKIWKNALELF